MKQQHLFRLSKRLRFGLCLSAVLLNTFNAIALAQKPQSRIEKAANENLLKHTVAASQPLSFEANQGQAPAPTRFLARKHHFAISLSPSEAAISIANAQCQCNKTLNLRFVGSNNEAQAVGEQLLNEKTNYLIGNDAKDFLTNIPHYARASFKQVYPGVDVVYYGDNRRLKYDILLAPGSDPNIVKIRYDGIEELKIDRDGNLVFNLTGGSIVQPKPVIYQAVKDKRRYVTGNYVIDSKNQVGFRLGSYDKTSPLVIDPVLIFATYLGGSGTEEGVGVATDFEGNAYIVGTTSSLNFPIKAGGFQTTKAAGKDVFVTKLNPNGNGVVYSTFIGGSLDDFGYGIAIDSNGNTYITGTTASANYPATAGALQKTRGGSNDAFVTKLNASGSALVYSTYLGGAGNEEGFGIALDFIGNTYVTGVTGSSNFKVTNNAMQSSLSGPTDAYVTKLDPLGSTAVFSTYVGGAGADIGFGIALERSDNNPIITGVTDSINFPATSGAFQTISAGSTDAFVMKLNDVGTTVRYATFLGGSGIDAGLGIAVDSTGNAYVHGLTDSANFPTTAGSLQPANGGGESDAFVTKLNTAGSTLIYSTYIGGNGVDTSAGIALDVSERVTLSGTTSSANFPVTGDAIQSMFAGVKDAFVSRLNQNGSGQFYSSFIGGAQSEEAFGVVIDAGANTYITGITGSANFPTTTGTFRTASAGSTDGFLVKIGPGSDSPMQLLLETAGPAVDQAAGLESISLLRDPFPVVMATILGVPQDRNTKVTIFLANLQLKPGENASAVIVNLVDGNNQSHDLVAEAVRQVPNFPFTQVTFIVPDNLKLGTCTIKVKAHGQISNAGTIRIKN